MLKLQSTPEIPRAPELQSMPELQRVPEPQRAPAPVQNMPPVVEQEEGLASWIRRDQMLRNSAIPLGRGPEFAQLCAAWKALTMARSQIQLSRLVGETAQFIRASNSSVVVELLNFIAPYICTATFGEGSRDIVHLFMAVKERRIPGPLADPSDSEYGNAVLYLLGRTDHAALRSILLEGIGLRSKDVLNHAVLKGDEELVAASLAAGARIPNGNTMGHEGVSSYASAGRAAVKLKEAGRPHIYNLLREYGTDVDKLARMEPYHYGMDH